jgi:hypothetical protein
MKPIYPKVECLLSDVKYIYQHPYHYTYAIQKTDNYIYLYDEMTLEIVGRTKVPFNEVFKAFTFTDNFNIFCAYVEAKANPQQQPQIIVFGLTPEGVISHQRHTLLRQGRP